MNLNIVSKYLGMQHSIAKRLLFLVFCIYFFIAVIMTIAQMVIEYRQAQEHVLESIKIVAETADSGLRTAIWDLDQKQVQSIIDGLTKLPEVAGAVVHDEFNSKMAEAGDIPDNVNNNDMITTAFGSKIFSNSAMINYQYNGNETFLGTITLYSRAGAVLDRVELGFILLIINAFIKTFFLGVIFLLFSHFLLHKPITKLTHIVRSLDLDNMQLNKAENIGVKGQNELTTLLHTFYEMAHRLKRSRDELKDINSTLEERVHQRTKEIEEKNKVLLSTQKKLEETSQTDPLTGWKNRRFLEQNIDSDIFMSVRSYQDWLRKNSLKNPPEHSGSILYLADIDNFKKINDIYGHASGDAVLKQFCEILKPLFRESDYAVRWGGEEFLLVARFTSMASMEKLANRIIESVAEHIFDIGNNQIIKCTCSVGVTHFPFDINKPSLYSWQETVEFADTALYMAKENGKNQWTTLLKNNDIRKSFSYNEFVNNHQSLIDSGLIHVCSSNTETLSKSA